MVSSLPLLSVLLMCLPQGVQPHQGRTPPHRALPTFSPQLLSCSSGRLGFVVPVPAARLMGCKLGAPKAAVCTGAHATRRRRTAGGQLQVAVGSARSMEDGGGELDPAKLLEQMRRQQQDAGWAAQIASSFAPKSSTEEFKLNWVGNIDRHQRQLFWRLITMLCDRIDPYLRWMRIAHDIIQGAKARALAMLAFAMTRMVPTLLVTVRTFAREALVVGREAAVLARLLLLRMGAVVARAALSLVGVGVALPPRSDAHAASSSRQSFAAVPCVQKEVPQLANALLQDPSTRSGVFPSGKGEPATRARAHVYPSASPKPYTGDAVDAPARASESALGGAGKMMVDAIQLIRSVDIVI
jgi:hypothetical protein